MYGCVWVCMGAMGFGGAEEHQSKVSKDTNGLRGHVFWTCMAGKFPPKRHTCVHRHRWAKERLRRVGMGLNGCRGMQRHVVNAKQGK